ncbi:PAS domain S-box protein [Sabulicella rubraurantiaca]|uniref:PAS domain S-box protein n=1 Tax=Sabulicella rubraurantiaca TaxID=2811429 RepID=UPI001A96433E|nr:PAS domain S-box protein [Sabulicella rubraurantiaca]
MAGQDEMMRRQRVLADFGDFVLDHEDLDEILTEGCRLIAKALGTDLAKVMEIDRETNTGFVRAGIGWRPGIVGHERVSLSDRSSEAYAIKKAEPVITNDIACEERFEFPPFLREHGAIALVNVPILLPGRRPWGILQVDAREPREFDQGDIEFLKTYSMVLGPVIDRLRVTVEREQARSGLAEREERLSRVLDGMGEGFGVLAPDFTILEHNREALRLDGRPRDAVVGRSHWEAYPGSEQSEVGQLLRKAMAERVPVSLEHQYAWDQGRARWLEMRAFPTADGALAVFWRDVTDRRQAEDALRESELNYRTLFESIDEGFVTAELICDADGKVVDALYLQGNPAASRLTGRRYDHRLFSELVPEAEVYWLEIYGRVARSGISERLERYLKPHGRWYDCHVSRVGGGDDGKPPRVAIVFQDITERRQAELALQESEQLRRLALESGGMGAWRWDTRERSVRADQVAQRLWGVSTTGQPSEVSLYAGLMHPEGVAWLEAGMASQAAPGEEVSVRMQVARGPNAGRWVQLRGRADPESPWIINGVSFDITDQVLADDWLRESEAQFRLMADVAPPIIWVTDGEGRLVFFNRHWENYIGAPTNVTTAAEVATDFVHPDDAGETMARFEEAARTGGIFEVEHRIRSKSGDYRWFLVRAEPYRGPRSGEIVRWFGASMDIHDRKLAEDVLRESEARFRGLVTAGSYMVYRVSADWQQVYQLAGQDVLADTVEPIENWAEDYLLPEDRPTVFAAIEEAIRAKLLFEMEHRVRLADGGVGWVLSRAVPILRPDGEIAEWFGAGSDVTARREAQDRLRAAEERYRSELEAQVEERTAELHASRDLLQATMDASTDMIQVFEAVRDEAGQITDFRWVLNNHTSESRYGEIRGESLLERNPGVVVEGIFDTFKRVTETGVPEQNERHYVHEQFDGWFLQSVVKLGDGVATTTKDITDWKAAQTEVLRLQEEVAQAKLRESEERFQLLVGSVRDYAILTIDREGLVTSWPPGAAAVFGWSEAEMLGRSVDRTFVPEDVATGEPQKEREIALREGVAPNVREHLRKDGARIFIDGSTQSLVGADGEVREFIKIGQDVTEARRVQQALLASEARLRTLVEGIPQPVWRSGGEGRWSWASPQWQGFTGQGLEASLNLGWLDAVHPADRAAVLEAWREARESGGAFRVEHRLWHAAEGRWQWVQSQALPVRGGPGAGQGGSITEWIGTTTDVEEMRQAQEQRILIEELHHRGRNLLAVVSGIAEQIQATSTSLEEFGRGFSQRLAALGRVQGLLSREVAPNVTVGELLRLELAAHGVDESHERVTLSGPEVTLPARAVQLLALALHELLTNALKHGALGGGGRLAVTWSTDGRGEPPGLQLDWSESGVAMPAGDAARRRGFGLDLLEQLLPYELDAETTIEFAADGLQCSVRLPLEDGGA